MIKHQILMEHGGTIKHYGAGDIIFSEGSVCHCYNQLKVGLVRWVNINESGKEFLQTMVEPGESFGELPLFDGGVYAATAIAETDCEVYKLPIECFHKLIAENTEIHFSFSRLLAQRVRFKFMIIKEFAHQDPDHRISALLHHLKSTQKNICPDCFQVKLTRQQIAAMTGLRVETVIRAMRGMHESGRLIIKKGRVYLPDMTEVIK